MNNPSARRLSLGARLRYGVAEHGPAPLLALLALLADVAAGTALHFGAISLGAHRDFSLLAAAVATWAGISALRRNLDSPAVRRTALLLISLTFSQLLAGVGAYMNLLAGGTLAWFPVVHALIGLAVLALSAALAFLVYRRMRPEDAEVAQAGVAIA